MHYITSEDIRLLESIQHAAGRARRHRRGRAARIRDRYNMRIRRREFRLRAERAAAWVILNALLAGVLAAVIALLWR